VSAIRPTRHAPAREPWGAPCLPLACRHGVERVVRGTSVLDATVGGFLIWVTAWSHEVAGLDVWCPVMGGTKLLDLLWVVGDEEFEVRTFKRPGEWVPQLLALAREKMGVRLH
jgi:hypothetical protein